ncbi:MAG TPA: discoidin domain-containing protein [Polyangiaceae bacterium]|nr:discoidin domain-containing protein [Polyangiaceae bacterium]
MGAAGSLISQVGEFVSLRRAEAAIRSYSAAQRERIALHHAAGDRRFRAARRATDPLAAALLYREAAFAYLRALSAARSGPSDDEAVTPELTRLETAQFSADPLGPPLADDVVRVRAALGSTEPVFFDLLDRQELERTRSALGRAVSRLRSRVEARSLINVLGTRAGRICACLLLAFFLGWRGTTAIFWPDLASGKPVTASSLKAGMPEDLVEGDIGTSYALGTNTQDSPWIAVDLTHVYRLTKIEIYNRVDGWFDDNLPLAVQTSVDGNNWTEVSRRTTTFGHSPPWIVRLDRRRARFVRAQGVGHMALALSKIRVYGAR